MRLTGLVYIAGLAGLQTLGLSGIRITDAEIIHDNTVRYAVPLVQVRF